MRLCESKNLSAKWPGGFFGLFESEAHAFGLFGAASFANDCFAAAFALGNWLRETHLRLLERHDAALKNLAVETTDEVFIRLVLIFSSHFNSHIADIVSDEGEIYKRFVGEKMNRCRNGPLVCEIRDKFCNFLVL